jgi:hypothetical protein
MIHIILSWKFNFLGGLIARILWVNFGVGLNLVDEQVVGVGVLGSGQTSNIIFIMCEKYFLLQNSKEQVFCLLDFDHG